MAGCGDDSQEPEAIGGVVDAETGESCPSDEECEAELKPKKEKSSSPVPSEGQPSPKPKLKFKSKKRASPGNAPKCCSHHNPFTHFPKSNDCPICNSTKTQRAHCKQKDHGEPDGLPEPKKFADAITADHKVLNEEDQSRSMDRLALIIQDRFTHWLQGYACKTKNAKD